MPPLTRLYPDLEGINLPHEDVRTVQMSYFIVSVTFNEQAQVFLL
jgi:hypothetical protein